MKKNIFFKTIIIFELILVLFACSNIKSPWLDTTKSPEERALLLLNEMTTEEKIGQIIQIDKANLLIPEDISNYYMGSMLSGGGSGPAVNSATEWRKMVNGFQEEAIKSRLAIPLLYGVDAVHGHNNVDNAVIFPHNIGLGATQNPDLVREISRITAIETAATGIHWTFAPCVAVPQDYRWGRTYEGFSSDTELTALLGEAAIQGLQGDNTFLDPNRVLATAKHFIGDGGTQEGVDQGNSIFSEELLRELFLSPYQRAIDAGVLTVMASFSSWNDLKMHANRYLLTNVLKGEMGFEGFVISDWAAHRQLDGDETQQITTALNAGIDMFMIPDTYVEFSQMMKDIMESGAVPMERLDDAVYRILMVKFTVGLFERPFISSDDVSMVGIEEHREVGRKAVRESMVLLKNNNVLPLSEEMKVIGVAGADADDVGKQCGGWSITWQGKMGDIPGGTSLLEALEELKDDDVTIIYSKTGDGLEDADIIITAVGERPYAEGEGDRMIPRFPLSSRKILTRVKEYNKPILTVMFSGRPMFATELIENSSAVIAAWLPGTEGLGMADVIYGRYPFTGKLPFPWIDDIEDLPLYEESKNGYLYPLGYGLTY